MRLSPEEARQVELWLRLFELGRRGTHNAPTHDASAETKGDRSMERPETGKIDFDRPSPGGPIHGGEAMGLNATMGLGQHAMSEEERQQQELDNLFTYHAPRGDQPARYNDVRLAAKMLATIIHRACPAGPDRSAAIRKLRECVMTANAAIALS